MGSRHHTGCAPLDFYLICLQVCVNSQSSSPCTARQPLCYLWTARNSSKQDAGAHGQAECVGARDW